MGLKNGSIRHGLKNGSIRHGVEGWEHKTWG